MQAAAAAYGAAHPLTAQLASIAPVAVSAMPRALSRLDGGTVGTAPAARLHLLPGSGVVLALARA